MQIETAGGRSTVRQAAFGDRWTQALMFSLFLLAASSGGCAWQSYLQPVGAPGPEIFMRTPTAVEAADAINANSNAVQELYAEGATISVQGFPALKASLAAKRPQHLRMQATILGIGGPALDVGSNDERFWFWTQETFAAPNAPKGVFYARHVDAQHLPMQQVLPIEPRWLIEALGVVTIDPDARLEGPVARGPEEFELTTIIDGPKGPLRRVLTIHSRYAWIMQQRLYGPNNELLAEAKASRHRYYPDYGVTLPEEVTILLAPNQPQQLSMRIFVGEYLINNLGPDTGSLFEMPEIAGQPAINLAEMLQGGQRPATITPPGRSQESSPRTGYRPPPLRGYQR